MRQWHGWDALVVAGTILLATFTWRFARPTRQLAGQTTLDVEAQWTPLILLHREWQPVLFKLGDVIVSIRKLRSEGACLARSEHRRGSSARCTR